MKKLFLAVALMIGALGFTGVAHADLLPPIDPTQTYKVTEPPLSAFDSGTLLTDAAKVIDYLGVREGEAYEYNQHRWVTTTGATIITYAPWNLGLGITMLNADGVTADIDWNVGAYLPVKNVPVMNLLDYLYIEAGIGGEETQSGNAFKFASTTGLEFKFNY